jgi:hypothetical protein
MKIKQVWETALCSWCQKEKECCEVELENETNVTLCWTDLKRMAKLQLAKPKAKV